MDILPDQHYINQIRKRLWGGKECGKVAVMVGAGFSLNANRVSQTSSKFLMWSELIREMRKDLFPYEKIEVNAATSEALRLASEYELVFGRQALDELLLKSLPDQNYVPGELHKLLLSLPWADVFTTNYDTLLEKTRMYIHDRKYDLVINSADLPTSSKPRIVKLHGSFPSNRPFIITEEDYRTYQKKFSAFINTVQQSIMENALCLVGFSGDDPNFLNWIGWVRDNLGMNTPPIYFCGFISNQSVKRTLEARGIVAIDLSPLFTDEKYPGGSKYIRALEWLLINLKNGKEFDVMKWPMLKSQTMKIVKEELPPIPVVDLEETEIMGQHGFELTKEVLVDLIKLWQNVRLIYPGWVIAPKSKRETIWTYTEMRYYEIMNSIKTLSVIERLNLLFEMNWRFEIALKPIPADLIKNISNTISELNPFENPMNKTEGAEDLIKFDKALIRGKWVELHFSIAKHAREEQNSIVFMEIINRLEFIININIEWKVKWYYEKCLFYLSTFNQDEIRNVLDQWASTNELPFWEIRRASILAEIGDLREAERIAEEALNRIRSMVRANQIDISILSQEGWAMILLRALKYSKGETDYSDRWANLGNYGCNPWQEIDLIKEVLKSSVPNHNEANKTLKGFDRGIITKRFSFGKSVKEEVNLSYAFLRILENAAIPLQCGNINMFSKEVAKAAKWIKPYSPFRCINLMIRCDATEELKDSLTRLEMTTLSEEEIKQYYDIFVPALEQTIDNEPIKGYSHIFYTRQIQNLSEMVSRVCIRFSKEQLESTLKIALKMYQSKRIQRDERLNKYIEILISRVFNTMSDNHKADWLLELLKLSTLMEEEYKLNPQNFKIDIFSHINFSNQYELKSSFDTQALNRYIITNLSLLRDEVTAIKERALLRLVTLYNIKALTSEAEKSFGQIIWGKVCEDTGMPNYSRLYMYSYLNLPVPNDKRVNEIMLNYLLSQDIPIIYQEIKTQEGKVQISYSGGYGFTKYVREWVISVDSIFMHQEKTNNRITLDNQYADSLLEKLNLWWQGQTHLLNRSKTNLFDDNDEHVEHLISFLSIVIAPNLNVEDQSTIEKVRNILNDIDSHGYQVLFAMPMMLNLKLYTEEEVKNNLTKALYSSDLKSVKAAIEAIVYWLWYGDKNIIPKILKCLLDELVNKLCWRKKPEISILVKYLIDIVISLPQYLDDELIRKICVALEYLLYETDVETKLRDNLGNQTQEIEELTDLRYYSAKLSKVMKNLMEARKLNTDKSDCLKRWEEAGKIDPLPEVRNLWDV